MKKKLCYIIALSVVFLWSKAVFGALFDLRDAKKNVENVPSNASAPAAFALQNVEEKAMELAQKPYHPEIPKLSKELADMDYDTFRSLRYDRKEGPWYHQNIPFELQFFHMGSIYKNAVRVSQIIGGKPVYIPYEAKAFTKADKPLDHIGAVEDYAGFRLHYPLNRDSYYDELISFLGASYFRALGKNQKYGLSARGLAIDTGEQIGEEFPIFREFWIKKPMNRQKNIIIYALLDSPRITGAYAFFVQPGTDTKIDVSAVLFARDDIQKLGIAPLTSMFLFGENTKNRFFDYRPEVHDSDGLLIHNKNGEWLWRPLDNAIQLRLSSFSDSEAQGFGLMQRDRNPDHYQDLEAHYQDRPSVWIEPLEGFGSGRVHLVEIPSDREIHDNVVAFWWPDDTIKKGQKRVFKYRMHWILNEDESLFPKAKVIATRSGVGGISGVPDANWIKFSIDFKGKALNAVNDTALLVPDVSVDFGHIRNVLVQKNEIDQSVRLFFDFQPENKTAELRASLKLEKKDGSAETLTEVWSYQYIP